MFFRLLLLFTLVPLIELAVLVWLGQWVGLLPTIALVFVTGVLGAYLARRQGLITWTRVRAAMARGELPGEALIDALLILIAGAVLLTPGLITD
ncbi:MAG: FxsA family protein, partial [Acidobacteriota bacterium]